MEVPDYKELFSVGQKITLSLNFINNIYSPDSWEQDCINAQKEYGSLKIIKVNSDAIEVEGLEHSWFLLLDHINLYQLEPYKENLEILYAFAKNQDNNLHSKNLSCPLVSAFDWTNSPEGFDFWLNIANGTKINSSEIKENKNSLNNNQQLIKNSNNHEIRLQKQKATIIRGTRPKGSRICSTKHKASIRSRQISYTACHC